MNTIHSTPIHVMPLPDAVEVESSKQKSAFARLMPTTHSFATGTQFIFKNPAAFGDGYFNAMSQMAGVAAALGAGFVEVLALPVKGLAGTCVRRPLGGIQQGSFLDRGVLGGVGDFVDWLSQRTGEMVLGVGAWSTAKLGSACRLDTSGWVTGSIEVGAMIGATFGFIIHAILESAGALLVAAANLGAWVGGITLLGWFIATLWPLFLIGALHSGLLSFIEWLVDRRTSSQVAIPAHR